MDNNNNQLERTLKPRHLNMIAIGGSIGTGLFLASGYTINQAGPLGALTAYSLIGIMVYFLMTSLGEMATFMPSSGSFQTYASKFVEESFGFALGWNYWYNWAITIGVEVVAGSLIMKYWFKDVPSIYFSVIFLAIMFLLNVINTKAYAEAEYWFAGVKVFTVLAFIFIGVLMVFGVVGSEPVGFSNLTYKEAPFVGGMKGILAVFLTAGFAFQGTELVGIAAGESENPQENIPKAIKGVFWRIIIFYIGSLFIMGLLMPYTDLSVDVSPFTLIFSRAGIKGAATIMNIVVLTAVLSCGNSGMYASTRMLYAMAQEGKAPKSFGKVNKRGIPLNALIFTTAVASVCFLTAIFAEDTVYVWLVAASGLTGFIAWLGISISHYRFRKAYVAQGKDINDLVYKAKWFPVGPILSLVLCIIVIIGQGVGYFKSDGVDFVGLITTYASIPIFLILWLVHKKRHNSKLIPLTEVDLDNSKYQENNIA